LDHITLKALKKKPKDRYQSVAEMLAELKPVRESLHATEPVPVRRIPKVHTLPTSILSAISHHLRQRKIMFASFLLCLGAALMAVWASSSWIRGRFLAVRSPQCSEAMTRGT